jgi:hypothetical protein
MPMFICTFCGTQYAESELAPARCVVCRADSDGDPPEPAWTTLDEIRVRHSNLIQRVEPQLFSIRPVPAFASGQRALLLQTGGGNVLWGCVAVIDDATMRTIVGLGGLASIAVSHPRQFSTAVEWSRAFGGVPVYVHATGRGWLMRPDPVVQYWEGDELRLPGVTLVHFGDSAHGGTVLHWAQAAAGRGALLTGDVVQVLEHRRGVGLLSSARDRLPRSADAVRTLVSAIARFEFDALYDAWADHGLAREARRFVFESACRYLAAISGVDVARCSLTAWRSASTAGG